MFQMKLPVHCSCLSLLCAGLTFISFFSFTAPITLTIITHLGDAGYVACGKIFVPVYAGTEVSILLIAWLNAVLQKLSPVWLLC